MGGDRNACMRIPNLGETELLIPLHSGVFEQPMWLTFLRLMRRVCEAEGVAIWLTGTGDTDAVALHDGELIGFVVEEMRNGRVYSGEEIGYDDAGLRAVRVEGAGIVLTLAVLAQASPTAKIASLLTALVPHLRVALRVLETIERERSRAFVSEEAFRRMNFGWIALDERCRIVDLDSQADSFLRRSGALRRGPYDRLVPSSPHVDRELTALAKAIAADRRHRPQAINISQSIVDMNEVLDLLEDDDPDEHADQMLTKISSIRRNSLALKRHMAPQHEALEQISRDAPFWFEEHDRREIAESIARLRRYLDDIDISKESALVLQDEIRARSLASSEHATYMLTIVAGIFLPLSFLTGLLGINVGGMPGMQDPDAFWAVVALCGLLFTALIVAFRRLRWL